MSVWFTADTHYGHANIIKFCDRPFRDADHMNRELIAAHNDRVQSGDLVIHVGDFGSPRCRDPRPILERLNGNILLIKGNHDHNKLLKHMPFWAERMDMRLGLFKCLINHRPLYPRGMQGTNDKFGDHDGTIPNPEKYNYIISGHIHEKRLWTGRSINVGVDKHEYAPISIEELLLYLKEREKEYNNNRGNVKTCI